MIAVAVLTVVLGATPSQARFVNTAKRYSPEGAKAPTGPNSKPFEDESLIDSELFASPAATMDLVTLQGALPVTPACLSGAEADGVETLGFVLSGEVAVTPFASTEVTVKAGDAFRSTGYGGGFVSLAHKGGGASPAQILLVRVPAKAPAGIHLQKRTECLAGRETKGTPLQVAERAKRGQFQIAGGKGAVTMLFEGEDAKAAYAGLLHAERGMKVPIHTHEHEAEILFVLRGTGTMTVNGESVAVKPGSAIHIAPGTSHAFENTGTEPLEAIQLYSPPGPEQRFKKPAPPPMQWTDKGAWSRCRPALKGEEAWPSVNRCEAMSMCANEAPLTGVEQKALQNEMADAGCPAP